MKYTALKTYAKFQAGKTYNMDESDPRTHGLLNAGIIAPFVKANRSVKVSRPAETK